MFGNIFRSLEQHCGVRAPARRRFLANFCESAEHLCRAPRSPAIRRSVRERLATARTRAEETEGDTGRKVRGLTCSLRQGQKARQNYPLFASLDACESVVVLQNQSSDRCRAASASAPVHSQNAPQPQAGLRGGTKTIPRTCNESCLNESISQPEQCYTKHVTLK